MWHVMQMRRFSSLGGVGKGLSSQQLPREGLLGREKCSGSSREHGKESSGNLHPRSGSSASDFPARSAATDLTGCLGRGLSAQPRGRWLPGALGAGHVLTHVADLLLLAWLCLKQGMRLGLDRVN